MTDIRKAKILVLATDGFEQVELQVPLEALRKAGATVEIAAPGKTREPGAIRGWRGDQPKEEWGDAFPVDRRLGEVDAGDYDGLVLPGGVINPDKLRLDKAAVDLIKAFVETGKVVAAICHAPWLLVEAGAVRGRRVTSFKAIKTDVVNAGGEWIDAEVVTDKGLITSRSPADLPAFVAKIVEAIAEGMHAARAAA